MLLRQKIKFSRSLSLSTPWSHIYQLFSQLELESWKVECAKHRGKIHRKSGEKERWKERERKGEREKERPEKGSVSWETSFRVVSQTFLLTK
jgi:hypothetical protein